MSRPAKKVAVSSEQRKQWLARLEENGESPPQIARKDGYDTRTVRRHIELALQERENRETRLTVRRSALESHYQDLCKFAERIDSAISREESTTYLKAERLHTALQQHLPKSPLWKYLDKWNNIHHTITMAREDLRTILNEAISKDTLLDKAFAGGKKNIPVLVDVFAKQLETWSRGGVGLEIEQNFRTEPVEGGMVIIKFGAYTIGTVPEDQAPLVKEALIAFEQSLTSFDLYQKLRQFPGQLKQLKPDIQEELAVIELRRIVPGRCKYCPV